MYLKLNNSKVIPCIILVFLSLTTQAQKLKKDEYDPYKKRYVRQTNEKILSGSMAKTCTYMLESYDSAKYLTLGTGLLAIHSIQEGNEIIFLFENDSTLVFHAIKADIARASYIAGITSWQMHISIPLSQSDIDMFNTNVVKGIRIDLSDKYVSFDNIDADKTNGMRKAIALLNKPRKD